MGWLAVVRDTLVTLAAGLLGLAENYLLLVVLAVVCPLGLRA